MLHCHGRISSLRLDLGGFPLGTQAGGGSVKVPLNLLERIILEGEFSEQEQANQSVNSLSLLWPCDCFSWTIPPGAVNRAPTHGHHMLSSSFPERRPP